MNYTTPNGNLPALYDSIAEQTHVLIGGTTGSGKTVTVRGIISALLYKPFGDIQGAAEFILIDPKGTELADIKSAPHTIFYSSAASENKMIDGLRLAAALVDERFKEMEINPTRRDANRVYIGSDVFCIIDELADLVLSKDAAEIKTLIQHIGQVGRAARVHMICCTQCPIVKVIPTEIKVNFTAILALRTRSAQDSRNIIGVKGAENFPKNGKAMYQNPDDREINIVNVPFVDAAEIDRLITHWRNQAPFCDRAKDSAGFRTQPERITQPESKTAKKPLPLLKISAFCLLAVDVIARLI